MQVKNIQVYTFQVEIIRAAMKYLESWNDRELSWTSGLLTKRFMIYNTPWVCFIWEQRIS